MARDPNESDRALIMQLRDEWGRLHASTPGLDSPNWHALIAAHAARVAEIAQRGTLQDLRERLLSLAAVAIAAKEQAERFLPPTKEQP